jgi:hypothetical protein
MQADKALVLLADFLQIGLRLQHLQTQAIPIETGEDLTLGDPVAFLDEYLYKLAADACQDRCLGVRSDCRGRVVGGEDIGLRRRCDFDRQGRYVRLRPVLLTTVTTILGLMPMVFALNIDLIERNVSVGAPATQYWTQLSSAVAGGLAFATILTLLLTPSLLMIQANLSQRLTEYRARTAKKAVGVIS